jgi:hypothetical protein
MGCVPYGMEKIWVVLIWQRTEALSKDPVNLTTSPAMYFSGVFFLIEAKALPHSIN